MFATLVSLAVASATFCSGISLQTPSATLLIPYQNNREQVFVKLRVNGLSIASDPRYILTYIVRDSVKQRKLPVAYFEFKPNGKISGTENIIPTETMGDAKNMLFQIAEEYRKQLGKKNVLRHNVSGTQYKILTSCKKIEIEITLSIAYNAEYKQYYVSIKTSLD